MIEQYLLNTNESNKISILYKKNWKKKLGSNGFHRQASELVFFLLERTPDRTALLLDFSGKIDMNEKSEINGAVRPADTRVLSRPSDQASCAEKTYSSTTATDKYSIYFQMTRDLFYKGYSSTCSCCLKFRSRLLSIA
jgi:hypothetical protein